MEAIKRSATQYFKQLRILHLVLLIGQLIFCGIAYFMLGTGKMQPTIHEPELLRTALPIAGLVAIAASQFVFRQRLTAVTSESSVVRKLDLYRAALILRFAIIESVTLLSIVLYMLSGEKVCLAEAILLVVWFAVLHPVRSKCLEHLGLDEFRMQEWEDAGKAE